ncbi:hypothetical protein NE237_028578 [Protea cynaroides]|uniref:Uncharacterized protein n=1 Tax=Protea cynaroides TaxID=273540 RepID=A0A9Q0GRF6_9MAGN|nr:hypothetical protein NE237_028578 [Protea cynaroides]
MNFESCKYYSLARFRIGPTKFKPGYNWILAGNYLTGVGPRHVDEAGDYLLVSEDASPAPDSGNLQIVELFFPEWLEDNAYPTSKLLLPSEEHYCESVVFYYINLGVRFNREEDDVPASRFITASTPAGSRLCFCIFNFRSPNSHFWISDRFRILTPSSFNPSLRFDFRCVAWITRTH